MFKRLLTEDRSTLEEHAHLDDFPSATEPLNLDTCDINDNHPSANLTGQLKNLCDDIKDISLLLNLLKDNSDISSFSTSLDQSSRASAAPRHTCLFCDRSFSTKGGLGLHKKSRHLQEYLLEIKHKYSRCRNHP